MWAWCALVFLTNCPGHDTCYTDYGFSNFTSYTISVTTRTPIYAIGIDDPKHELDLGRIDQTVRNVSECVLAIADGGFSEEEFIQGECYTRIIDPAIKSCMTIKVAPDWHISPCSGEQLFSCDIGTFRCEQKGLIPDPKCPCSCRGIIQDGDVVIITPNMRLLPATLTTLMTGCLSPWVGRLAACSANNMIAQ